MIYRFLFLLSGLILINTICPAQKAYELNSGWKCIQAGKLDAGGDEISRSDFNISNWMPAVVPGTVLTTLIANKSVPDPFYGLQNEQIPDIYTTGRDYYTYWFVKDFKEAVPAADNKVWLHFRGVNYSYDAYINGHKLTVQPHTGMYLRARYDITPWLSKDGNNRLAVIVHPPDPVGNPNGGQGGDGVIARNVCNQYVAGWDWIPAIHDRNTGIWDKVTIERTGPVVLSNMHIVTDVPGVRQPAGVQAPAFVHATAELENTAAETISGSLSYTLQGKKIATDIRLAPGEKRLVTLPVFTMNDPQLWWPNGYGAQHLYHMRMQFFTGQKLSDEEQEDFGVRTLQAVWNTHTQSRELRVNGQRVFIKGGNWIASDALLRFTPQRYDAEVRFHRDMNLNLIRIWGGGLTERPEFYNACDKYGLLVFQDFWVSGDCNGRWYDPYKKDDTLTRRMYPDDHGLFIASVADQVKLLRNHPSLAYWCGGNEIKPPADILDIMRDSLLTALDGTRFFFSYSNDDSMSLHSHDGPYSIQPDTFFWKHRSWPFNSEVGSVGIGDMASLERFLPEANRTAPFYDQQKHGWVSDTMWRYHKITGYDSSVLAYGPVKDMNDYLWKAQMVNYNQYRALAEGISSHMWDWYTGVIIWKTQNPWTAMRGQMYDYYLDPNACLYGLRKGAVPLRVMFNPLDSTVMLVNDLFTEQKDLSIGIHYAKQRNTTLQHIHIGASECKTVFSLKELLRNANDGFLVLRVSDGAQDYENLYWLADAAGNYTAVQQLPRVTAAIKASRKSAGKIQVTISNTSGSLSFFNRISLEDKRTHKRVLPVFYSDNYISVLPGATKTIELDCDKINAATQEIVAESWNGPVLRVAIK